MEKVISIKTLSQIYNPIYFLVVSIRAQSFNSKQILRLAKTVYDCRLPDYPSGNCIFLIFLILLAPP
jgi:hypothetical protein